VFIVVSVFAKAIASFVPQYRGRRHYPDPVIRFGGVAGYAIRPLERPIGFEACNAVLREALAGTVGPTAKLTVPRDLVSWGLLKRLKFLEFSSPMPHSEQHNNSEKTAG
jgi:hypothetical protein